MMKLYFSKWEKVPVPRAGDIVAPHEYFSWPHMTLMGLQHLVAMFGSTILAPILMGFDPNVAVLMSGIGTIIFFLIVGGRVPSYLGSSFAFIAMVVAVTGYDGSGANVNIGLALGGIIACGILYTVLGLLVSSVGSRWIDTIMPPVVTGGIVAIIGLNLAPIAVKNASGDAFTSFMSGLTILLVAAMAVFTRGMLQRLMILIGMVLSYIAYFILANIAHLGPAIDFQPVLDARWFGMPQFASPSFSWKSILYIAPIALILVAENLGHIKAVSAMTGTNLDKYVGRAFVGDGIATVISGFFGGTGVTTYAENIGVMAATRIYSSLVFLIAAGFAVFLGFSPKFGAMIHTIPVPVLGGVSVLVFGMIAVSGVRIWLSNRIDFSDPRNLIIAAVTLIIGAGDFTIKIADFVVPGIATATIAAVLLNMLLKLAPVKSRDG